MVKALQRRVKGWDCGQFCVCGPVWSMSTFVAQAPSIQQESFISDVPAGLEVVEFGTNCMKTIGWWWLLVFGDGFVD